MRESLFRGKNKRTGDWMFGGIVHQTDFYGDTVDRYFIIDGTTTQDYDIGFNDEAVKETIGEFTGLTDKNGKMIFEGDIVKLDYTGSRKHKRYEIIYDIEMAHWFMRNGTDIGDYELLNGQFARCDLSVIGNIHDNPELLGVGK